MVHGQLSLIDENKSCSIKDGIIPPLNPANRSLGPRLKVLDTKNIEKSGWMGQEGSIEKEINFTKTRLSHVLGDGKEEGVMI